MQVDHFLDAVIKLEERSYPQAWNPTNGRLLSAIALRSRHFHDIDWDRESTLAKLPASGYRLGSDIRRTPHSRISPLLLSAERYFAKPAFIQDGERLSHKAGLYGAGCKGQVPCTQPEQLPRAQWIPLAKDRRHLRTKTRSRDNKHLPSRLLEL